MIPKFRAWDSVRKKFVEHFFITDNGLICNMEKPTSGYNSPIPVEKSELILMQSTGLKDKNGQEIFEGDIVSIDTDEFDSLFVKYETGIYWLMDNEECVEHLSDYYKYVSIIGNIYENPDLLEVE